MCDIGRDCFGVRKKTKEAERNKIWRTKMEYEKIQIQLSLRPEDAVLLLTYAYDQGFITQEEYAPMAQNAIAHTKLFIKMMNDE